MAFRGQSRPKWKKVQYCRYYIISGLPQSTKSQSALKNLKYIYIGIGTFLEILAQYLCCAAAVLYKAKIIFFI